MDNIFILQSLGYTVDVACNFQFGSTTSNERVKQFMDELRNKGVNYYHISVPRGAKNIVSAFKSYKSLKSLIEKKHYDLVHCHSPIGGVIARCACIKKRADGLKVIYTAHGFHFFKGSPKKYWLFFPVEKFLSRFTDLIITINKEDFELASNELKALNTKYIPGVGIDTKKYINCKVDKKIKRIEIGIPEDSIMILSVGELVKRKNHEVIIKAISKLEYNDIYYVICGKGQLDNELIALAKLKRIEDRVIFLGFRQDIPELCKVADIYAFPSKREGLGLAGIEGMAAGLPIVSSNLNGIVDYSVNGVTGYTCKPDDVDAFAVAIEKLYLDKDLREKMGKYNVEVSKRFDIDKVDQIMSTIYKELDMQKYII
jgi:glycosyltransferase involved in cell wall biosynthesis